MTRLGYICDKPEMLKRYFPKCAISQPTCYFSGAGLWSSSGIVELQRDCGAPAGLWSSSGIVELQRDCGAAGLSAGCVSADHGHVLRAYLSRQPFSQDTPSCMLACFLVYHSIPRLGRGGGALLEGESHRGGGMLLFCLMHCTALHCITLHYTVLYCITLHYNVLHCITLHYTALHCIIVHYTALHCIALHYTAL